MSIITVENLKKSYITYKRGSGLIEATKSLFVREKVSIDAVNDISFKVNKGEIVGFLGPNGAGKSTTMNILTGYLSSNSGIAEIDGVDILEHPLEAKKHVGYLPEQPPLYLDMTVV